MKKILSSILVLTLTLSCGAPCSVYASDKIRQVKTKTIAQEKEINKLTEELEQQLKKIDEVKNMSKESYRWYNFKKILSAFSKILLGISVPIATFFYANKYGFSNGFSSGVKQGKEDLYEELKDKSICGKDYADGFNEGYKDYILKNPFYRSLYPSPEDVPSEAGIRSLFKLFKKTISPAAFDRYRFYFKNGTEIKNFYKQSGLEAIWIKINNIMDKMKKEEEEKKTQSISNPYFRGQNYGKSYIIFDKFFCF